MKHVTLPNSSLLLGDRAADLLLAYAALLAQIGRGDHVSLRAIEVDGAEVEAGFLLNVGTSLLVESTDSHLPEPDNGIGIAYMEQRLDQFDLDRHDDPNAFGCGCSGEERHRP